MSNKLHEDQKHIPRNSALSYETISQNIFTTSKRQGFFWRFKNLKVGEQNDAVNGIQHGQKIENNVRHTDVLETIILTGSLAGGKKTLKETNENVFLSAKLTAKEFTCAATCLKLTDIVAVSYNDGTCQFTVHSFPISKSYWSYKMKSRKQKDIQFLAPDIEEALKWIYAFESQRCFINHSPLLPTLSKKQGSRIDVHDSPPSFYVGRVMLVIINPRSGHGRALKVYSSEVEPILKLAGIKLNVVETTGPHHAEKLAANIDISTCLDGIICVGGDGIVNEVVNGLLSREDIEKQFKQIPIGVIPAGSDNSLCWSVMGVRDPSAAALAIVKGNLMLTDIFAVEWMKTGNVHMGLTITYHGFMSDVLELSEKYQKRFGPLRYFFAGARKFICLPAYECEIEYLPANIKPQQDGASKNGPYIIPSVYNFNNLPGDDNTDLEAGSRVNNAHEAAAIISRKSMGEYDILRGTVDVNNESSDYVRGLDAKSKRSPSTRGSTTTSGSEDVVALNFVAPARSPSPRPRTRTKSKIDRGWSGSSWDYSMLGGEQTGEIRVSEDVTMESKRALQVGSFLDVKDVPQTDQCHVHSEDRRLEAAEDEKWVFKQGPFLAVLVCNHQCRTVQCVESQLLAPNAKHDDRKLDLLLIHKVGRLQLLRFLILMQFGRHLSLPFVQYTKVKAVKLKPGNSKHKGCGIDGELMNLNEPISITVLREQCQLIGHRANN